MAPRQDPINWFTNGQKPVAIYPLYTDALELPMPLNATRPLIFNTLSWEEVIVLDPC